MPARCNQCGLVAPDDRLMHKYWQGPTGDPQLFCPACWNKRQQHTEKLEAVTVVAMILVIAAGAALLPAGQGGAIGRLAIGIIVVEAVSVFLHELGHATAAWAMGMRVFKLSVGMGRNLLRRRFGHTELEINLLPTCGYVLPGDRTLAFSRTRHLIVTACGPAVNIGLAAWGFAMVGDDWSTAGRGIEAVTIFHLLASINAVIVVWNLVPMGFAGHANDGMLMLMTALARGAVFRRWLCASVAYQVHERLRAGDAEAALAAAREGAARYADVPEMRIVFADTLGRTGRYREARREIDAVLAIEGLDKATGMAARITLAQLIVDAADADAMAEADRCSDAAMREAGDDPSVRLLRGRVLVATGWVEKGAQLIHPLLDEVSDPEFAAACACAMAHAELARGDRAKARHYRDIARSLDEKCRHLPALDRERVG